MDGPRKPGLGTVRKVFDPRDTSTGSGDAELLDPSVMQRGKQWWMYLAGQASGYGPTEIYSASLPSGTPLSAVGWNVTRGLAGEVAPLAGRRFSQAWDGNGGRHCPSYVKGWDPGKGEWVERIYYAGAAENLWGPYTIGFLQWDGENWIDQSEPAFAANEDWEHGSVYEPNVLYHDGKWKMWYVAGSNQIGLPCARVRRKRRRQHRLEQACGLCATRNEDVRFLRSSARRWIRRHLRARLGQGRNATSRDRIVVVQGL